MLAKKASQIFTIHIGQAGVQIGHALWELFCLEHGISCTGERTDDSLNDEHSGDYTECLFTSNFLKEHKFVPRALLVDLEPSVVDEVRVGAYRSLWNPTNIISSTEGGASNFARGYYAMSRHIILQILEKIRQNLENCDNFACFQIFNGYAGGTGSGFTSLLIEKLSELYGKKYKFGHSIYPSQELSAAAVDPYNSILHQQAAIRHMDCVVMMDNQSLFNAMSRLHIDYPTYSHINRAVASMLSGVFLSHRYCYQGSQHASASELLINLVPYPRIHFPILAHAPFLSYEEMTHTEFSTSSLVNSVFKPHSKMLTCEWNDNKFLSCVMLYRGNVSIEECHNSIIRQKNNHNMQFVEWCPTGFKIGVSCVCPVQVPGSPFFVGDRSLTMLAGNVGIANTIQNVKDKFDKIYSKRAFVHWFVGEGMEEGEFSESREEIETLVKDYEEIAKDIDIVEISGEAATKIASQLSQQNSSRLFRSNMQYIPETHIAQTEQQLIYPLSKITEEPSAFCESENVSSDVEERVLQLLNNKTELKVSEEEFEDITRSQNSNQNVSKNVSKESVITITSSEEPTAQHEAKTSCSVNNTVMENFEATFNSLFKAKSTAAKLLHPDNLNQLQLEKKLSKGDIHKLLKATNIRAKINENLKSKSNQSLSSSSLSSNDISLGKESSYIFLKGGLSTLEKQFGKNRSAIPKSELTQLKLLKDDDKSTSVSQDMITMTDTSSLVQRGKTISNIIPRFRVSMTSLSLSRSNNSQLLDKTHNSSISVDPGNLSNLSLPVVEEGSLKESVSYNYPAENQIWTHISNNSSSTSSLSSPSPQGDNIMQEDAEQKSVNNNEERDQKFLNNTNRTITRPQKRSPMFEENFKFLETVSTDNKRTEQLIKNLQKAMFDHRKQQIDSFNSSSQITMNHFLKHKHSPPSIIFPTCPRNNDKWISQSTSLIPEMLKAQDESFSTKKTALLGPLSFETTVHIKSNDKHNISPLEKINKGHFMEELSSPPTPTTSRNKSNNNQYLSSQQPTTITGTSRTFTESSISNINKLNWNKKLALSRMEIINLGVKGNIDIDNNSRNNLDYYHAQNLYNTKIKLNRDSESQYSIFDANIDKTDETSSVSEETKTWSEEEDSKTSTVTSTSNLHRAVSSFDSSDIMYDEEMYPKYEAGINPSILPISESKRFLSCKVLQLR